MSTQSDEENRGRARVAEIARKMWLDGATVKTIEKATEVSYHVFTSCVEETQPNFFELHPRKRGRKFQYRDSLDPKELGDAVRMYLLKEKKPPQICAHFKIAPYKLRELLEAVGVWRSQTKGAGMKNVHSLIQEKLASETKRLQAEFEEKFPLHAKEGMKVKLDFRFRYDGDGDANLGKVAV